MGERKKQSSLGNNCHNMLPPVWERQCRPAETVERGAHNPPPLIFQPISSAGARRRKMRTLIYLKRFEESPKAARIRRKSPKQ